MLNRCIACGKQEFVIWIHGIGCFPHCKACYDEKQERRKEFEMWQVLTALREIPN